MVNTAVRSSKICTLRKICISRMMISRMRTQQKGQQSHINNVLVKKERKKQNKQRDYVEDLDTDRRHVNNLLLKKHTNKDIMWQT